MKTNLFTKLTTLVFITKDLRDFPDFIGTLHSVVRLSDGTIDCLPEAERNIVIVLMKEKKVTELVNGLYATGLTLTKDPVNTMTYFVSRKIDAE